MKLINTFVFELESDYPGWDSLPIKAYSESYTMSKNVSYGPIQVPSIEAISLCRLVLGNTISVRSQRLSTDNETIQIDAKHFTYGKVRILVSNLQELSESVQVLSI